MRVSDSSGKYDPRSSSALRVAVLGASANPKRYSHKAVARLGAHGHTVFPVNPGLDMLLGLKVFAGLADLPAPPHTITLYVGPERSTALADAILAAHPRRVIFNPGAENPALAERLKRSGIHVLEACTLVLLSTDQFGDSQESSLPAASEATEDPQPRPLTARH
jgi:predicted CoA-binding protein